MEIVTTEWKNAHKEDLLPENFVEITYKVTEVGLNDSYTISTTPQAPMASTTGFQNAEYAKRYATLELNQWLLDGSRLIMADEAPYGENKFISKDPCGEDCLFEQNPMITLNWEEVHSSIIPGITIRWSEAYNEYPTEYKIVVYNGETVVSEKLVTDNDSAVNVIFTDIEGFNKVSLEVIKWNLPRHRARIEQLYVGIIKTYQKADLMAYDHEEYVDMLSGELPKNTFSFSLENVNGVWNPLNPQGQSKYLAEQQTLNIRYGMKLNNNIEWIDAGTVFMSEWETPSNGIEAKFTASNVLGFLEDNYTGIRTGTLYEIALSAITQVTLPDEATYDFDVSLATTAIDFSKETSEFTIAEILQMVANAGKCIMYQDRKGCLHIKPFEKIANDYIITLHNLYSFPEFKLSKELKGVNVNDGLAIVENAEKGVYQSVSNPLIKSEEHAVSVGQWTKDILKGRKTVTGEFRPDTRLSAGDSIITQNKYDEAGSEIFVTSVKYTFDGGFTGTFEGRVL